MDYIIEAVLAIVSLGAYFVGKDIRKYEKYRKILIRLSYYTALALFMLIAIVDPVPLIIGKVCVFSLFAYIFYADDDFGYKHFLLLVITLISVAYATSSYVANIKVSEDVTLLSETTIEIQCIGEKISVTETDGKYNYVQKHEGGGISFESIPEEQTTKVNIADIDESCIKEIVEEYTRLDYNCNPPRLHYKYQETRYELYAPEWSIIEEK